MVLFPSLDLDLDTIRKMSQVKVTTYILVIKLCHTLKTSYFVFTCPTLGAPGGGWYQKSLPDAYFLLPYISSEGMVPS